MNSPFSSLKVVLLLALVVGVGYFISMQVGNKNVDQSGAVANAAGNGASVTFVSQNVQIGQHAGSNNDVAVYTIKYRIKAPADTPVYVAASPSTGYVATSKFMFAIDKAGVPLTQAKYVSGGVYGVTTNMTDSDVTVGGNYMIDPGSYEIFEMTVVMTNNAQIGAGLFRAKLANIKWNTTDSASVYNNFANLPGFATSYVAVD